MRRVRPPVRTLAAGLILDWNLRFRESKASPVACSGRNLRFQSRMSPAASARSTAASCSQWEERVPAPTLAFLKPQVSVELGAKPQVSVEDESRR